jgi:hypothetical protein
MVVVRKKISSEHLSFYNKEINQNSQIIPMFFRLKIAWKKPYGLYLEKISNNGNNFLHKLEKAKNIFLRIFKF